MSKMQNRLNVKLCVYIDFVVVVVVVVVSTDTQIYLDIVQNLLLLFKFVHVS